VKATVSEWRKSLTVHEFIFTVDASKSYHIILHLHIRLFYYSQHHSHLVLSLSPLSPSPPLLLISPLFTLLNVCKLELRRWNQGKKFTICFRIDSLIFWSLTARYMLSLRMLEYVMFAYGLSSIKSKTFMKTWVKDHKCEH